MTTQTEEKILDFMEKLYFKTEADKKELMEEIRASRYDAKSDLAEFKQEMSEFKQEMSEFKQEMSEFKQEMSEFKQEMSEFKQEITAEVKDLSHQMKEVHIVLVDHSAQLKEINGKVDQLVTQQKRSEERFLWMERKTANS